MLRRAPHHPNAGYAVDNEQGQIIRSANRGMGLSAIDPRMAAVGADQSEVGLKCGCLKP